MFDFRISILMSAVLALAAAGVVCAESPLVAASQGISARSSAPTGNSGPSPIITNDTLKSLAGEGRIAAVGKHSGNSTPDSSDNTRKPPGGKDRDYWRKQHVSTVATILKTRNKLRETETRLRSMEALSARPMTLSQRMSHEAGLEAQQKRISSLRKELAAAQQRFDSTIRGARRDGGKPDWFRDLPRP